jgi:putative hydrolase of the HAD superfamily
MIRTLLFDLGDVLVKLDFDRAYRAAAKLRAGSPEEVRRLLHEADLAGPYERGEIDSTEFHRRCDSLLGLGLDFEAFSGLWGDMFAQDELVSPSFVEALGRNYRLAILSNTNPLHHAWLLPRYPVLDLFSQAILSFEVGAMKPSATIYDAALKATGSRAEECFFTDDREENIEGARALGIRAERFTGQAALEDTLDALGVEW